MQKMNLYQLNLGTAINDVWFNIINRKLFERKTTHTKIRKRRASKRILQSRIDLDISISRDKIEEEVNSTSNCQ